MKKLYSFWSVLSVVLMFSSSAWGQCSYSLELNDTWGDGWNGNSIDVEIAGVSTNYTLSGGYQSTITLSVNNNDSIVLFYNDTGNYQNEVSFELFDANGVSVYASGQAPPAGNNLDTVAVCPACPVPSLITQTAVSQSSLSLTWGSTGAGAYILEWGPCGFLQSTGTIDTASTNSFTITGLTAGTCYDVYITSNCNASGNGFSTVAGPFTFNTAQGVISSFPYSEGFETGNGGWASSGTNSSWEYGSPSNTLISGAATGSNAWVTNLTGNYNNSENSYLATPFFDLSSISTNIQISFNLRYETENGYDEAWLEYTTDGSTWNKVVDNGTAVNWYNDLTNEWWENSNTSWQNSTIILSGLGGFSSVQFRFAFSSDGFVAEEGVGVDDFGLQVLTCSTPSAVSAINVTSTTADIQFTSTAVGANIQWGPSGFTLGTGATIYNATSPAPLTGLSAGSAYDVYVQDSCGAGNVGVWIGPYTFSTQQGTINTFPYTENFDAGPGGWLASGTNGTWEWGAPAGSVISSAAQGANAWVTNLDGNYSNGEMSYLTSVILDCSSLTGDLQYSFYMNFETENGYDEGWVEYTFDGTTWVKLVDNGTAVGWYNDTGNQWWEDDDGLVWAYRENIIPGSAGQSYVQLRHVMSSDGSVTYEGFGIDDVTISELACPVPFALGADADTATADLYWSSMGNAWNVQWGPQGFAVATGGGNSIFSGNDTLGITGLTANTCYDFYVQDTCGGASATWVGPFTFCTPCGNFAGDDFNNPIVVNSMPYNYTGSTANCFTNQVSNRGSVDIVFEYTATPGALSATFSLCGSGYDTYLYLLDASQGTIASNDDACGLQSEISGQPVTGGQLYYVVVEGFSSSGTGPVTLTITEYSPCPFTGPVVSTGNGCNYVDLAWTGNGASSFEVEYGNSGYVNGTGTIVASTDTVETISGLSSNSLFDFYVRGICGADTSAWVGPLTQATANGTNPVINASAGTPSVGMTSADVTFTSAGSVADSVSWDFGDGSPIVFGGSPTHTYNSDGTYTVIAGAITECGVDTVHLTVIIQGISLDEQAPGFLSIYPNPTTGVVNIALGENASGAESMELFDLRGKMIESYNTDELNTSGSFRVNMSTLPKGVYVLRWNADGGSFAKRIILQ